MYLKPANQDELETLVRKVMEDKRISFVAALYKIMDDLRAQENAAEIACGKGCSFCCRQIVTCTNIEWAAIEEHMRKHGVFEKLQRRFRTMCEQWLNYLQNHRREIALNCFKPLEDWNGAACVFLSERGECDIYAARPIDCRTFTSTMRCAPQTRQAGVKRFRYPWELWANNILMEEAERDEGRMQVTPLIHRLAVCGAP